MYIILLSPCTHVLRCILQSNIYVILTNMCFSSLAIFHLVYLGLMFDSSDGEETVRKLFKHLLSNYYYLQHVQLM